MNSLTFTQMFPEFLRYLICSCVYLLVLFLSFCIAKTCGQSLGLLQYPAFPSCLMQGTSSKIIKFLTNVNMILNSSYTLPSSTSADSCTATARHRAKLQIRVIPKVGTTLNCPEGSYKAHPELTFT